MSKIRFISPVVASAILFLVINCISSNQTHAAAITWTGSKSTDWNTSGNWSGNKVPGSGDDVTIDGTATLLLGSVIAYSIPANMPVIGASGPTNVTIKSLTIGSINDETTSYSLIVNSGYTLNAGSITEAASQNASISTIISGAGAINCSSVTIGNDVGWRLALWVSYTSTLTCKIANLHVTGNVSVIASIAGIFASGVTSNANFILQDGATLIDGTISTSVSDPNNILVLVGITPNPYFHLNTASVSGNNTLLQLSNANAIGSAFNNSIDFYTGTGPGTCTVQYINSSSTATQEIYTSSTGSLSSSPQVYQNLTLSGTGTQTQTADGSNLSIGGNLTTSTAASILLNVNNPITTVGGSWTNSAPVTQGSGSISVTGSLTNNTAGTLTLGIGSLNISTNYANSGTYTQSTGTTTFNGTTQSLTDNSTNGTKFNTVIFTGGGTKTINASATGNFYVNPTYVLTVNNNSTLSVNNISTTSGLTLLSSATGDALIASLGNTGARTGTITGNVNVQRFVDGGVTTYRGYRLLSSPVNISSNTTGGGNVSLAYLDNNQTASGSTVHGAYTGGPGGTTNGFTFANANPTIYLYDESKTVSSKSFVSGKNVGVVVIGASTVSTLSGIASGVASGNTTTANIPVPAGNSYMLYFIGDDTRSTPSSAVLPNNTTLTATGTPNQGTLLFYNWKTGSGNLSFTTGTGAVLPGLDQVGNPYASSINLDSLYHDNFNASSNNIGANFYEVQVPSQSYISYNATTHHGSTTAIGATIASGQGFFITAQATGQTLTFKENQKVTTQLLPGGTTNSNGPGGLQLASKPKADNLALQPTAPSPDAGMHLILANSSSMRLSQKGSLFCFSGDIFVI